MTLAYQHTGKVRPTPQSVAATPYFQLQVNAPTGQAVLILAKVDGDRLGWYGAQHDAVFTRQGRLVKTIGLTQNLDDSAVIGPDPFALGLNHLQGAVDYQRRMDWSPNDRYGVIMQAHMEQRGMESVEILGTVRQLRRIDEQLSVPGAGIHMSNRYWVDPANGFIWKSRQYVAPGLPLELIALRPYQGPKA